MDQLKLLTEILKGQYLIMALILWGFGTYNVYRKDYISAVAFVILSVIVFIKIVNI